ncbi:hypothetical protein [Streptomyces sp. NPDC051561]|uniref:hypothetical protein n=1 Tax=Streptomyces sp. NPDC051561 TaxID=3365658 RepID=UPI0037985B6A
MPGHGHTPPRSQPSPAVLVTLRVVFTVLALCTCGLLTWAAPLRIAILRQRATDWVIFSAVAFLGIGTLMIVGTLGAPPPPDGGETEFNTVDTVGMLLLLAMSAAVTAYYLVADIKHYRTARPQPWGEAPRGWGSIDGPAQAGPYAGPQHSRPTGPQHPMVAGPQHPMAAGQQDRPTYPHPQQQSPAPGPSYGYPPQQPQRSQHQQPPQQPQSQPHQQSQPQPQTQQPPLQPQSPLPPPPRINQVRAELDELSELLRKDKPEDQHGAGGHSR